MPDKTFIDARTLRLAACAVPDTLILGRRVLSDEASIRPVSRIELLLPLIKSMVLGLELQQSLAYFLLRNHKDGFSKAGIGVSRLHALIRVLAKSRTYRFDVGGDTGKNAAALKAYADSRD